MTPPEPATPPERPTEADLRQVVERELALLEPDVRRDAGRVLALLHPDFLEYGASGRVWDRKSITSVTSGADAPIRATDLQTRYLGADAVLVTYRSREPEREALRSSVWLRDAEAGWLLLFHQGTPSVAA
jgi:ribonuclease HI